MAEPETENAAAPPSRIRRYLPAPESRKYHLLLGAVALFILGPLGGVTAAYMNFSLGFFVGGQVLAGILGSTVTYGYGAEGKHGANYMQTMAASVASMSGMAVLIQAMTWLGIPLPATWKLILYFCCIGMFGIGVGMLYTPILVDRLKLEYPSGHAVANILRALTDARLLRRSIGKLGGGTAAGIAAAAVLAHLADFARLGRWAGDRFRALRFFGQWVLDLGRFPRLAWIGGQALDLGTALSASTIGAGLIVGSRIAVPAAVMGGVGALLVPHLRASGWLGPHDPFRKIGFLIGLAMIMGAAAVDLTLIGVEAVRRFRRATQEARPPSTSGGLGTGRLAVWVGGWAIALVLVATLLLDQPIGFVLLAIALVFLFVFINGIANGISDSNPISSAFVVSVLLMSSFGLRSQAMAIILASILLVSCTVGVDMQQDRSTGWRLQSNRAIQFRYQAVGILMGGVLCVVFAQGFMRSYPELRIDSFTHPEAMPKGSVWQSAMTFKFVGAIRSLGPLPGYKLAALGIGLGIGLMTEVARKLLARSGRYLRLVGSGPAGFALGWTIDAIFLSSPYASSFGGFIDLSASIWFAVGGVVTSLLARKSGKRAPEETGNEVPEDMSTASLIGGGLIAGESLYTLAAGLIALLALLG